MAGFDYSRISNPVYSLENIDARDPAVLVVDSNIYLYFTYYDPVKVTWHVAMTTTVDFINYSPARMVSPEGYASPGNVIRVGERWCMCYQQYREFPHYLCLSWSDDLVNWSEPVGFFNTGDSNKWNIDGRVIDPYIFKWGNTYYCWYVGSTRWGRPSGHNLIGTAVSDDLRNWKDITTDAPAIGVDYDWEEPDGNENNCVVRRNRKFIMLYSASLMHQKIAYAESDDLLNWTNRKLCDVPVFNGSKLQSGAPFIIEGLTDDNKEYMIYQGTAEAGGHVVFYLLESDDLIVWR